MGKIPVSYPHVEFLMYKRNKRVTWSELSSRKDSQEGWAELKYYPLTSEQACNERKLLFASDDCPVQSSRYTQPPV